MSTTEIFDGAKWLSGFVKIWKVDPVTGDSQLLVDKQNMILKGGAKLITHALAGVEGSKIWGMYIGFNNTASFTPKTINPEYSDPFSGFSSPFGYLREPLTFTPTYMSSPGYTDNTVLFSTMITSSTSQTDAVFDGSSRIYEVGLIAAPTPSDPSGDVVFSRTNFNAIQYDSSFNFTISWGIRILLA